MRRVLLSVLVVVSLAASSACTLGGRGNRHPRPIDLSGGPVAAVAPVPAAPSRPDPDKIAGTPSILVLWEPLAVEQARFRDPATATASNKGRTGLPAILVNASFVPRPGEERELRAQMARGTVGKLSDREMLDFVAEIEKTGFFDYAKPTDGVQPYFASERARGRITVERDGVSVTLLSLRGLGLAAETKAIPAIYAAVKDSIVVLKNSAPTVGVSQSVLDRIDPDRVKRGEPPVTK